MTAHPPADHESPCVSDGEIHLGDLPRNPPERHTDVVMRIVSAHFGNQWYAVKLSGWWLIVCKDAGVHWGVKAGQYTHDFARALAEATGLPVYRDTPPNPQG